jgi:hypothetical protein
MTSNRRYHQAQQGVSLGSSRKIQIGAALAAVGLALLIFMIFHTLLNGI